MILPGPWRGIAVPDALSEAVERAYRTETVYPPREALFRALELTPPERVRVVLLGQDPYHEPGQATGLAFSVPEGTRLPPSLRNIFRERSDDLALPLRTCGDLTDWARQGVLLLNTALTVRAQSAGSHAGIGWGAVVDGILLSLARQPAPIAALLWGRPAAEKAPLLASEYPRLILKSAHPSPLSAYRGFFGSRPFSECNRFLTDHGEKPIAW